MDKKVVDFIEKHRISVLTTLLPDGKPHSASMHYATDKNGAEFVFFTKEKSRKCINFEYGKSYPASVVVGFSEEEFSEFQSDGVLEMIAKSNSKPLEKVFASKFTGAELDSEHIVLKYTPTWWRYSEFKPKFSSIESK